MNNPIITITTTSILVFLSIFISFPSYAVPDVDGEWERKIHKKRHNISVYTRERAGFTLRTFMGVMETESTVPSILSLMSDWSVTKKWLFLVDATLIEKISDDEYIVRVMIKLPPPVKDRDAVLRVVVTQNPATKIVRLTMRTLNDVLEEQPGFVRAPDIRSDWRFIPLPDGKLRMEYEGYGDVGGKIPEWVVNMFLSQSPYITLKRMKRMLKKDKYIETELFQKYSLK